MISAPASPSKNHSSAALLPELFGRETQLLGWQGISAIIPADWNLASFAGDLDKGNFRLTDDEGLRLEVFWEKPKGTPDVEKSIALLLSNIEREAKKKKHSFEAIEKPKLIPTSRKEHADKDQLLNFGWKGDADQDVSHGWGAAWHCAGSRRVVVAHIVGRRNENGDKTRRLAAEVLSSMQSKGVGGWQTWSAFGLQLEIPEEFQLTGAKLQTGRLEFDWQRVRPHAPLSFASPRDWFRREERIGLRRLSAANVVLEVDSLEEWARRVAAVMFKKFRFWKWDEANVGGEKACASRGQLKDLRRVFIGSIFDFVMRRPARPPELLVWHNEQDNKIFVLLCDLRDVNAHVKTDLLDSLESRQ